MTDIRSLIFEKVLFIRVVEEVIADFYSEQEMRCPVHLSIGQEGVAAGVCTALNNTDKVLSGHRSHAHYLAKGGDLKAMLLEIYGKNGCSSGIGGSMHMTDASAGFIAATPIVGSTIPIACGVAFVQKLHQENAVTTVFLGDGATETGVFFESLNIAALKGLPIVFVCEDNDFSVYSSKDVRLSVNRNWQAMVEGHGISYMFVDGQDGLSVYEAMQRAKKDALKGQPCFLHAKTYRYREHCGPNYDDELNYRLEADVKQFNDRDPVKVMSCLLDLSDQQIVLEKEKKRASVVRLIEKVKATPNFEDFDYSNYTSGYGA